MKILKLLIGILMLAAGAANPGLAAPLRAGSAQTPPPVTIQDDLFADAFWTTSIEATGGASAAISQQTTGGIGISPFRFMSHRLPPVTGEALSTVVVNHIYQGGRYDPRLQGAISAIDYREAGLLLSFPWPEAFSTTRALISQGGRLFRSERFIRFIAQNSAHAWETKSLTGLTAADFVAVDGSGDHPDFSPRGSFIRFGFTRSNSRGSTQPPVPADQDLVIDQGVDNWEITIYGTGNRPPQATDDTFILDGSERILPLLEFLNVTQNDRDPDLDRLEVVTVTQPLYGSAGFFSDHTVVYQLDEARARDTFDYTISDGVLSASARVDVLIDCACTVLCLNGLEPPEPPFSASSSQEEIDLPLIYGVRERVLKSTPAGKRYVSMYYTSNPEILVTILGNEALRTEAVETVTLWQPNLRSLVEGDGSAVITQAQVDALDSFLTHLSAASSPGLQQLIAGEQARLGPLGSYVSLTVKQAKSRAIGDPAVYLPVLSLGEE